MRRLSLVASGIMIAVAGIYMLRPGDLPEASRQKGSSSAPSENSSEDGGKDATSSEARRRAESESPTDAVYANSAPTTSRAQAFQAIEDMLQRPLRPEILAIEHAFLAEAVDPSWAPGRESDIYGVIAQMTDLELIALQVECRTSMCRIQLTQRVSLQVGEPGLLSTYGKLFDRLEVDHRPVISATDRYGTATSLTYLPRRGQAEPSVKAQ